MKTIFKSCMSFEEIQFKLGLINKFTRRHGDKALAIMKQLDIDGVPKDDPRRVFEVSREELIAAAKADMDRIFGLKIIHRMGDKVIHLS